LFVRVLGSEAGNLALTVLATGGVYLGGGIPPRILDFLSDKAFIERFGTKGRLSQVVQRIPVQVILHPDAALLGAACYGLEAAGCTVRR
jgi:glucokinase